MLRDVVKPTLAPQIDRNADRMVGNKKGQAEVESESTYSATLNRTTGLMRSKRRVADHGEVFTPVWLVERMLDLVHDESERIDSRVLEPACGSGNFLVPMLRRKLTTVELRYGKSDFERRHQALFGLMCLYGIELLDDNVDECRANCSDSLLNILEHSAKTSGTTRPEAWLV